MPVLVVQLGHCYRRTGATGTTGEQAYATRVGQACMALLNGRGGWSVRVILADDPSVLYRGNAFFAIHCDGSTSAAARGASVGYRTPEGQAAAQAWKRAYDARGWDGFRPDNYTTALAQYYGTGTAVAQGNRRAVILECGFRTNAADRALLDAAGGPERVALSIGDALGIPVTPPEDDMPTVNEILMGGVTGKDPASGQSETHPFAEWFTAMAYRTRDVHQQVPALIAALSAATNDPDINPEQLGALIDQSVADHTPSAQEIAEAQRPFLAELARDVLPAELADQFVDELVSRLANSNPEGN